MGKALLGLNLLPDTGVGQGRLHLPTVPDDARILQQFLNFRCPPCGDYIRGKPLKSLTKTVSLAQNSDPTQTGLIPFEDQLFPKCAAVIFGHAPLVIVIGVIERIITGPATALHALTLFSRPLGRFATNAAFNISLAALPQPVKR